MSFEFEDTDTLSIDAEWLTLFEPGQSILSPRRRVPRCKNLDWWIECNPNGDTKAERNYVSVFICASAVGYELTKSVTVKRSDVKYQSNKISEGFNKCISHDKLKLGDTIKDGIFAIKCDVMFKVPLETIETIKKLERITDSCIIKFDRKKIDTLIPGNNIVEQKRTVDGFTWWIDYFPCGNIQNDKGFVSLFFHITGGPVTVKFTCAMSVDGVPIVQNPGFTDYGKSEKGKGFRQCFSHKQVKLADHKNDIIDIVCETVFIKPAEPTLPVTMQQNVEAPLKKQSVNDSITVTMVDYQLDHNEVGEFDSTPKAFVNGSDKHQWRLLCFPAGDTPRSKGHISLIVEASTTETKTVTLSGVIRIVGTTFEKKFNTIVETDSVSAFPKFISHEELRRIGGIVNGNVTIVCEGTFHTFSDLQLN
uniref:MATH domain-containing protein n=1 Tax=Panagrellus redivivus TaxID=6233 RepID=A0A7E4UTS0_PANRE